MGLSLKDVIMRITPGSKLVTHGKILSTDSMSGSILFTLYHKVALPIYPGINSRPKGIMMDKIIGLLLLLMMHCTVAFGQDMTVDELRRMYDYDQKIALDIKEITVIERNGVRIRDITYSSPLGGRVTAYIVEPVRKGRFAGIVFGHWGYGTRTEFLPEAIQYAKANAISILIDYPWVRPAPWRRGAPSGPQAEAARDIRIAAVIDLRRAVDLLLTRPDTDPNRIAYVGHSFGAQWGAILSAVDDRIRAAVLIGGVPSEATMLLESNDPQFVEFRKNVPKEQIENYLKITGVTDAIRYVPYAAPTPLLFQFARFERFFDEASMRKYAHAASEPKLVKWYDTGHEVNDVQALVDRAEWLRMHIGIKSLPYLNRR